MNSKLVLLLLFCVLEIECCVIKQNKTCVEKVGAGINTDVIEPRGKDEDFLSQILPFMVMPFMVQTTILPMILMSMKFMLAKSIILGKLAILLGAVTFLRHYLKNGGGLFSHNINIQPKPSVEHEEIGPMVIGSSSHPQFTTTTFNKGHEDYVPWIEPALPTYTKFNHHGQQDDEYIPIIDITHPGRRRKRKRALSTWSN